MVGWLTWSGERRVRAREEGLLGLPVLRVGLWGEERGLEKRMGRCARLLERSGVRRVLTPPGFPGWPALAGRGLSPVETAPLCRALAARLVSAQLARRDVPPDRAVAALAGDGVSPAMIRAAEELCPRVRTLIIAAPGGEELARYLRWEYGLPVLEPDSRVRPQVTACFSPGPWGRGETVLRLWGERPDLAGLALVPPAAPAGTEPAALAALLWEEGRLEEKEIEISTSPAGTNSLDRGG